MEGKEISIQEILGILLSHIRMIIVVTILAGIVGYSYAKFVLPLQYTASIKIYVTNGKTGDQDNDDNLINAQDLNTARSLATTYIVILDDPLLYESISDKLLKDYDVDDLKNYFTISVDEKGNEYRSPFEIGKELKGYLNMRPQVPNGIDKDGINKITCLKLKEC